jgi:hypothetical protein
MIKNVQSASSEAFIFRSAYCIRPIGYADLLRRLPEEVGQDALF